MNVQDDPRVGNRKSAVVEALYPLRYELSASEERRQVQISRPVKYKVRAYHAKADGTRGAPIPDRVFVSDAGDREAANGVRFMKRGTVFAFGSLTDVQSAIRDALEAEGLEQVDFESPVGPGADHRLGGRR